MSVRQAVLVALAVVAQALALQPGTAAQGPGMTPSTYEHVIRSVADGDEYSIACSGATSENNGSYVAFFALTDPTGSSIYGGQGQASFGITHPTIKISVADETLVSEPLPEGGASDLLTTGWVGTVRASGKLRVVWAAWTTPITCAVVVNGVASTPASLNPGKAVQARLNDFTGTATVDSEIVGAGAGVKFERDVDGFVYSWLWAEGAAMNRGPGTQSAQSSRFFFVGKSTGTWTHAVSWGYHVYSIRGFVLETPA